MPHRRLPKVTSVRLRPPSASSDVSTARARQASFGKSGEEGRRSTCRQHRLEGDVNRGARFCRFAEGCGRVACFGRASHSPVSCAAHRLAEHVDLL